MLSSAFELLAKRSKNRYGSGVRDSGQDARPLSMEAARLSEKCSVCQIMLSAELIFKDSGAPRKCALGGFSSGLGVNNAATVFVAVCAGTV